MKKPVTKKSSLLTLVLLLGISTSAMAHDSAHYICTGSVGEDGDRYGIAVQFDEGRAAGGVTRDETLSVIWAGDLYQGTHNNKDGGFGQLAPIKMSKKGHSSQVFFQGTYELVPQNESEFYGLRINGLINLMPGNSSSKPAPVSTTLQCINITT